MKETWKPSPVRGDLYEVSSHGRVRTVLADGSHRLKKLSPNKNGYLGVGVTVNGRKTRQDVHRLVAGAFLAQSAPLIRHLDGDRENNHVENLAPGTSLENNLDTVRHGHHNHASKTHCPQGHAYDDVNTYRHGRHRHCRPCNAAAARRYKARKGMAA